MSYSIDMVDTLNAIEDYFNPNHNTDELPALLTEFLVAVGVIISSQPSAQPEIVRCRDCKYSIDFYDDGECYCRRPNRELDWTGDWNFYCGAAERRTDES